MTCPRRGPGGQSVQDWRSIADLMRHIELTGHVDKEKRALCPRVLYGVNTHSFILPGRLTKPL